MIETIREINGSKIIASRELKKSDGLHEVLCEDMTIHTTDDAIDTNLPNIESMSIKITSINPIMPSDIRFI